ncbi:hypothetical protein ACQV2B_01205 [Pantoea allii]|uniref:hypothetical protein n=1 Tax=Pantoea allii TaxID=574096 RepID=UPI0039773FE2
MNPQNRYIAALSLFSALSASAFAGTRPADTTIALSRSFAGNTWCQQMMTVWNLAAEDGIRLGLVAKTNRVNADNAAQQQASCKT